ncbi:MAG: hypothetical protein ACRDOU_32170 [Streptosporangiaceae bacterium]
MPTAAPAAHPGLNWPGINQQEVPKVNQILSGAVPGHHPAMSDSEQIIGWCSSRDPGPGCGVSQALTPA